MAPRLLLLPSISPHPPGPSPPPSLLLPSSSPPSSSLSNRGSPHAPTHGTFPRGVQVGKPNTARGAQRAVPPRKVPAVAPVWSGSVPWARLRVRDRYPGPTRRPVCPNARSPKCVCLTLHLAPGHVSRAAPRQGFDPTWPKLDSVRNFEIK